MFQTESIDSGCFRDDRARAGAGVGVACVRVGDSCVGVCMRLGTCMRGGEERGERRERRRERGTQRMRVQSACAAAGSAVTACILVCVCSIARRYAKSPGRRKAGAAETEHVDLSAPAQAPPPAPAPVPAPALESPRFVSAIDAGPGVCTGYFGPAPGASPRGCARSFCGRWSGCGARGGGAHVFAPTGRFELGFQRTTQGLHSGLGLFSQCRLVNRGNRFGCQGGSSLFCRFRDFFRNLGLCAFFAAHRQHCCKANHH